MPKINIFLRDMCKRLIGCTSYILIEKSLDIIEELIPSQLYLFDIEQLFSSLQQPLVKTYGQLEYNNTIRTITILRNILSVNEEYMDVLYKLGNIAQIISLVNTNQFEVRYQSCYFICVFINKANNEVIHEIVNEYNIIAPIVEMLEVNEVNIINEIVLAIIKIFQMAEMFNEIIIMQSIQTQMKDINIELGESEFEEKIDNSVHFLYSLLEKDETF